MKIKFIGTCCLCLILTLKVNSQKNNNVSKEFSDYIEKYKGGCTNKEGLEWLDFCIVDLKRHSKYFPKQSKFDSITVFFQFCYELNNIYLIEYRIWKRKSEYFAYIIYNSTGKIIDNIEIKTKNEHDLTSKEVTFSKKDTLLKVISFDPVNKTKLDHKFFAPEDAKNPKIQLYSIKKGRFIRKKTRIVEKEDWN